MHTLCFSVNLSNYSNSDSSPMTLQSVGICVSEYHLHEIAFSLKPSNGLRYWRWGGRGICLEAEKLEATHTRNA
jgi:hypothetical protein